MRNHAMALSLAILLFASLSVTAKPPSQICIVLMSGSEQNAERLFLNGYQFLAAQLAEDQIERLVADPWNAKPQWPSGAAAVNQGRALDDLRSAYRSRLTADQQRLLAGRLALLLTAALPSESKRSEWERSWEREKKSQPPIILKDHGSAVGSVAFSHDLKFAATGSEKSIRIFETATGQLLKTIPTGRNVESIEFSPDDQQVVVASHQFVSTASVWDLASELELKLHEFETPRSKGRVGFARYNSTGDQVLVSDVFEGRIRIFAPLADEMVVVDMEHKGKSANPGSVLDARFIPGTFKMIAQSNNRALNVFDIRSGDLLQSYTFPEDKLNFNSDINHAAFTPAGNLLVIGSYHRLNVFDVEDAEGPRLLRNMVWESHGTGNISAMAFSPDEQKVLIGTDKGAVWIWDWRSGFEPFAMTPIHRESIRHLDVSSDGNWIAAASNDGTSSIQHLPFLDHRTPGNRP